MTVHVLIEGLGDVGAKVVYGQSKLNIAAQGEASESELVVKDIGVSAATFITGKRVTVDVDSTVIYAGYVQRASRQFWFAADKSTTLQRRWLLTLADLNILFQKRVAVHPTTPAVVGGPVYKAETYDDTAIAELLSWLDLSTDDLDTSSGVNRVGLLNPSASSCAPKTQNFSPWQGSDTWGQAMSTIAQLPAAIFGLVPVAPLGSSPFGKLIYADVDIADAPFDLSDEPSGSQVGYRDCTIWTKGEALCNESFAWGFGKGANHPVFSHRSDATSIADHGLWQRGDEIFDIWCQDTIDRVTDAIINGSPGSRRGQKNDILLVDLTTFKAGYQIGQKVRFISNEYGIDMVLPIRRMQVDFPTSKKPRFMLSLSEELDRWGFADPFLLPPIGGFPIPPIPIPPISPGSSECEGSSEPLSWHDWVFSAAVGSTFIDGLEVSTAGATLPPGSNSSSAGQVVTNADIVLTVQPILGGYAGGDSTLWRVAEPTTFRYDFECDIIDDTANSSANLINQFDALHRFGGLILAPTNAVTSFAGGGWQFDTGKMLFTYFAKWDDTDPITGPTIHSAVGAGRVEGGPSIGPCSQAGGAGYTTFDPVAGTWYSVRTELHRVEVPSSSPSAYVTNVFIRIWERGTGEPSTWLASFPITDHFPVGTVDPSPDRFYQSVGVFVEADHVAFAPVATTPTEQFSFLQIGDAIAFGVLDDFNRVVASGGWGNTPVGAYPATFLWNATSHAAGLSVDGALGEMLSDGNRVEATIDGRGPWSVDFYAITIPFTVRDAPNAASLGVPARTTDFEVRLGTVEVVTIQMAGTAGPPLTGDPKSYIGVGSEVTFVDPAFWVAGGSYILSLGLDAGTLRATVTDGTTVYSVASATARADGVMIATTYSGGMGETNLVALDQIFIQCHRLRSGGNDPGGSVTEDLTRLSTTLFQTSSSYLPNSLRVTINGLTQRDGVDYIETDPVTGLITFTSPLLPADKVSVSYISGGVPTI